MTNQSFTIGQRLKRYRTQRGMSQVELADGICSHQTVSLVEKDKHTPSAEILRKLAEKLEIPFYEIMQDRESELEAKLQLEILKIYTEQKEYSRALDLVEELEARPDLTENHRTQLSLLRAECWMRTDRPNEAVRLLTQLKNKLEADRSMDDAFMAEFYNKLGNSHNLSSNMIYAHMHYLRALELCEKIPESRLLIAEISFNLGVVCGVLGFYTDAKSYLDDALKVFNELSDMKRLASTYFSLGVLQKKLNQFDEAESYMQQALALYRCHNVVELAFVVRQQFAASIMAEKDPAGAITELLDCVVEFDKNGDDKLVIHTYARIASIYIAEKQMDKADRFIKLGHERIACTKFQHDPRYVYLYQVHAKYCLHTQDFERAVEYSLLAAEYFEGLGLQRDSADCLQICVEAYRKKGRNEEAFFTLEKVAETLRRAQETTYIVNGGVFQ
ncbi:helix-turn-helix transcriptional regulator [Tumebacillus permanentifrigoris]|uniref:DNA-binding XRE family transcriptional regulator n=1 Tax=Tumebacillus permanentifrigoris TaxID=378543 RepID=A0A316DAP2_9BACL|nr:helix-turn-helix transcriptional regulator [Tumebacillus permanentifrigoris]PWK14398.1 DNA-binding XRE family transcriptional regulator [Tumebacillus permanentifrigoris]